jgi:hypothetical protein
LLGLGFTEGPARNRIGEILQDDEKIFLAAGPAFLASVVKTQVRTAKKEKSVDSLSWINHHREPAAFGPAITSG